MPRSNRLSYANVTASLALFIALGGTGYAAAKIDGKDVVNGSLSGADIKNESIRSADVSGLRAKDFAAGQLPAGAAGATGAQGPAGPQGLQGVQGGKGDQGVPGPIEGTPAGGALSGTYPNPGIAAGAVGPNALAPLPGARANAGFSNIPNNTATTVDLVTEDFDTGGMYTPDSDSITVQRTGTYLVIGLIHWADGENSERQLRINRNGLDVQIVTEKNAQPSLTQQIQGVVRLTAGNTIALRAFQDSGAPVGLTNFGEPPIWIAVQYLSG